MNWIRKTGLAIGLAGMVCSASAQDVKQRLTRAVEKLLTDSQMRHATLGLSILNASTGEKIVEVNAQTGLAPASCQKIITGASALELLGADYRYITELGYTGTIANGVLKGDLHLVGSGDPSFGSWRYASATEGTIKKAWLQAIRGLKIKQLDGKLIAHAGRFESNTLPGGWIWDDIGNYYGAGVSALNWHENQYDLTLRSGSAIGSAVHIVKTNPRPYGVTLTSELTAAAKGTGDNAFIYLPPTSKQGYVRGTIPVEEKAFTISGSIPDPPMQTLQVLSGFLDSLRIKMPGEKTGGFSEKSTSRISCVASLPVSIAG